MEQPLTHWHMCASFSMAITIEQSCQLKLWYFRPPAAVHFPLSTNVTVSLGLPP